MPLDTSTAGTTVARMTRGKISLVAGVCIVLAIGLATWRLGQSQATSNSISGSFRVQGNSMVPTLVGAYRTAGCEVCRLVWLIEPTDRSSSGVRDSCAHCGHPLIEWSDPGATGIGKANLHAAVVDQQSDVDTVTIDRMAERNDAVRGLSQGDLVSVRWDGQLHVKRVVAVPGDTVSLQQSRLLVNGVRIEDALHREGCQFPVPWMLVDEDSRREESRWASKLEIGGDEDEQDIWVATGRRRWSITATDAGYWLVYRNRSTRRGNFPAPVRDDYPFNVSIARKLFVVDRLQLRGRAETGFDYEIAFWSGEGNVLASGSLRAGESFSISIFDGVASDGLPVSPQEPIAIRAVRGKAALADLVIERLVEYRLRPHDDRAPYPLRLGPDQWFLLGDNVPVSIDSRQWGPLTGSRLMGPVVRRDRPFRPVVFPMP